MVKMVIPSSHSGRISSIPRNNMNGVSYTGVPWEYRSHIESDSPSTGTTRHASNSRGTSPVSLQAGNTSSLETYISAQLVNDDSTLPSEYLYEIIDRSSSGSSTLWQNNYALITMGDSRRFRRRNQLNRGSRLNSRKRGDLRFQTLFRSNSCVLWLKIYANE